MKFCWNGSVLEWIILFFWLCNGLLIWLFFWGSFCCWLENLVWVKWNWLVIWCSVFFWMGYWIIFIFLILRWFLWCRICFIVMIFCGIFSMCRIGWNCWVMWRWKFVLYSIRCWVKLLRVGSVVLCWLMRLIKFFGIFLMIFWM